jgi:hypothetical protein
VNFVQSKRYAFCAKQTKHFFVKIIDVAQQQLTEHEEKAHNYKGSLTLVQQSLG